MKASRPLPVLVVACTLVAGVAPRALSQAPAMEGYPAVGSPATVTLLEAGAAPKKALRYAVPAGQKAQADMTMSMSMAMNMAGMSMPMDLPGMKMTMAVAVTGVAPNGDITYDLGFTGLTFDSSAGANPTIAAALQPLQASITSIKGSATISSRGVTKSSKIDAADPSLQQMLGQVTSTAENLAMPFPEEAIGVGARFEVRNTVSSGGQTMFQKSIYQVVSIEGSTVSLKITSEQTAPPQAVSNPALPAGSEMYMDKMAGSGTGTTVIHLDSLVPTSEMNSTSSMSMTMSLGGQSQAITTDNKIKITIAPAK